ncbi:YheT family hydrolase [Rubrivivax albus]|uniref:Alpha/beta fold hydrolase n=1 Tax=Rubrivivax albus TaxID=2499835 RepID=A0A3S2TQS2_9BURK|nr:alpha/beta fold hydrolase [Rubrivivax albus]RVT51386.1 alpha/beta fold hydrolase [Rubrivivax albus]
MSPEFRAPAWLPGGHAQTIWPALTGRRQLAGRVPFRRERWDTPDGDFVDLDFAPAGAPDAPLLVLFHGLEGSTASHYALSFALEAEQRGWGFVMPHFRGCSGELNRAPRAYHSGDHAEIDWFLGRLAARQGAPVLAAGVSLGGNALMRWAGEVAEDAARVTRAVVSVCSPLDLTASGQAMGRGFNRHVYTRMFLATMKPKALAKWQQHPGLFDRDRLAAARTLYDFDNVFTAPLHGFRDTDDYWARASARPHLRAVRIPALALNARNDPFVPADSLPGRADVSSTVELWQPAHGGHVGFPQGRFPGHVQGLPAEVCHWLAQHA